MHLPYISDDLLLLVVGSSQWIIRFGAVLIVPFRRSAEAAKGWLLLFMLAPWLALALYTYIGRARHPKWRRDRVRRLPQIVEAALGDARHVLQLGVCVPPPQLVPTTTLGKAIGGQPPVEGSSIELQPDYDEVIRQLAVDIDQAVDHVHLMFYIFAYDAAGETILSALERANARQVRCRLMIDALGSSGSRRRIARRLRGTGIEFEVMLPVRLFNKFGRADLRNHRKLAIIDGRVGWIGSQNIIDSRGAGSISNRELMVRATGPVVAGLQTVFIGDWYLETEVALRGEALFPDPVINRDGGVAQIVASGPDYPRARLDMLFIALIDSARRAVTLTTPYFIPSEPLFFALRAAGLRGLKVQLIMSLSSDSRFIDLAQGSYYGALLEAGVRIALCRTHFLHAKHMSVDDDIALIGSSNLDMRSFELNSEVTLISYDRKIVERLHELEAQYLIGSKELSAEAWRARSFGMKVSGNMARLVIPLL